jgi:hypothetical protein
MRKKEPPRDFFGELIEVGDDYFYGSPPTNGTVKRIVGGTIIVEYYDNIGESTMRCASPERGVCLNKIKYVN